MSDAALDIRRESVSIVTKVHHVVVASEYQPEIGLGWSGSPSDALDGRLCARILVPGFREPFRLPDLQLSCGRTTGDEAAIRAPGDTGQLARAHPRGHPEARAGNGVDSRPDVEHTVDGRGSQPLTIWRPRHRRHLRLVSFQRTHQARVRCFLEVVVRGHGYPRL